MSEIMLESATKQRVIENLSRTLKLFHEAEAKNEGGSESISWRGQLGGFRGALETIFGRKESAEILEAVREETELQFPHMGPVCDDGNIYGIDSEAGFGL